MGKKKEMGRRSFLFFSSFKKEILVPFVFFVVSLFFLTLNYLIITHIYINFVRRSFDAG